jgi:hypothetical protein
MELSIEELTDEQRNNALIFYVNHLNRLKRYNDLHKKELNEKAKEKFRKIRENPEQYDLYKARKRELYKLKKRNSKNEELTLID